MTEGGGWAGKLVPQVREVYMSEGAVKGRGGCG